MADSKQGQPRSAFEQLRSKWRTRREEWARLGVRVDGACIASELLDDLEQLERDDTVTLHEAAALGGYSRDHLARLVSAGRLTNAGRRHAPRIRRADVPIKPGHSLPLPSRAADDQLSARRRIVADAIEAQGA